jgi:hypothetical protein
MACVTTLKIVVNLKSTVRLRGMIRKDPHSFELMYPGPGRIYI